MFYWAWWRWKRPDWSHKKLDVCTFYGNLMFELTSHILSDASRISYASMSCRIFLVLPGRFILLLMQQKCSLVLYNLALSHGARKQDLREILIVVRRWHGYSRRLPFNFLFCKSKMRHYQRSQRSKWFPHHKIPVFLYFYGTPHWTFACYFHWKHNSYISSTKILFRTGQNLLKKVINSRSGALQTIWK